MENKNMQKGDFCKKKMLITTLLRRSDEMTSFSLIATKNESAILKKLTNFLAPECRLHRMLAGMTPVRAIMAQYRFQ